MLLQHQELSPSGKQSSPHKLHQGTHFKSASGCGHKEAGSGSGLKGRSACEDLDGGCGHEHLEGEIDCDSDGECGHEDFGGGSDKVMTKFGLRLAAQETKHRFVARVSNRDVKKMNQGMHAWLG